MIQASGPYNVFGDNAYASLIGSLREATQGLVDVSIYFFIYNWSLGNGNTQYLSYIFEVDIEY